jgi:hypothetical protein
VGRLFGDYSNDTSYPLQSAHHIQPRSSPPPTPHRTQEALLAAFLPEALSFALTR